MAAGPSLPTMMVSTTPCAIQPSSLNTTGTASTTMARNSAFHTGSDVPIFPILAATTATAGPRQPALGSRRRNSAKGCLRLSLGPCYERARLNFFRGDHEFGGRKFGAVPAIFHGFNVDFSGAAAGLHNHLGEPV